MSDNSGNQTSALAPALIIFLCILGAGFVVLCGFAIVRHFQSAPEIRDEGNLMEASRSQEGYMREVRMRNMDRIAGSHGGWRRW